MRYYVILKSRTEVEAFYRLYGDESDVAASVSAVCKLLEYWCNKVCVEVGNGIGCVKDRPDRHEHSLTVTFEQYLALQAKKPTQERITAEEVIKVLCEECSTGKYRDIFGFDHFFGQLEENFTPQEIVSKVADWKEKQVAKVKVSEDMIADALDEKFGVGNWTREEKKG